MVELCEVEIKWMRETLKTNFNKFPKDCIFQLKDEKSFFEIEKFDFNVRFLYRTLVKKGGNNWQRGTAMCWNE